MARTIKQRLTVAITSDLLFYGFILWAISRSNMDGFTALLVSVLFIRMLFQDWAERLNRWTKEETFAKIQEIMHKVSTGPVMNPVADTGLKFEADAPPHSQR